MLLRGASADALAALRPTVDAAAGAEAAALGEDLFSVAALLRTEPGLRRVLTDQSTDASAKAGFVRSLLTGKVGVVSLDLLAEAAGRRWTASRDLADVLEYLGVVAVVRSAGTDAVRLSDELFTVTEVVDGSSELRAALSDPARSVEEKAGLLRGLLEGKTLPGTVRLAVLALNGSHRTVSAALGEFQKIAAAVQGENVAKVRVARDLSEGDQQRIGDALARQYGRPVHLNVVVEPNLVGGLRIEIGDDVIDGSIAARLADARRKLAG